MFQEPVTYMPYGRLHQRVACSPLKSNGYWSLHQAEHKIRQFVTNRTFGRIRLAKLSSEEFLYIFVDNETKAVYGYIKEIKT